VYLTRAYNSRQQVTKRDGAVGYSVETSEMKNEEEKEKEKKGAEC
jgi:hypothetical protein